MSVSHTQPSELLKLVPEGSAPNERRRKPAMLHRQTIPSVTAHVHEDSVTKMWSAYMVEAEKHDQRISDGWRDDANGVLIFAGLFSATVGAFVIEGYKKLSPEAGDKTTFLLGQISQQLAGLASNEFVQPVAFSPSSPTTSIILVNCMWLLSLVLSICAALSATLMQEWARRYIQIPQIPSGQVQRARKYYMDHAVEMIPTLLHLSVFLFFAGLTILIFASHQTVAIVLSISVGLFGLVYFALTILSCFRLNCPYRTPISSICWYIWHSLLSFEAFIRSFLLKRLHNLLVPSNLGEIRTLKQRKLIQWLDISEDALSKHGKRLKDGFPKSVVQGALDAPVGVDLNALTWMLELPALAERKKVQNMFISVINSTLFYEAVSRLQLDSTRKASVPIPNGITPSVGVLNDLRTNFAKIGLMRVLWADNDPAIRVIARSICALLARHFLRKYPLMDSELAWLQEVMGSRHTQYSVHSVTPPVDSMNIDSFIATLFVETLAILKSGGSQSTVHRDTFEDWISGFIERAKNRASAIAGR
ncbi:hypothetical protein BGW80DRAFT_1255672 [Lactifluus volemus]|nr:hypothetical protein BGW80DRAFT_1255672 [Lactifluus volemus]